MATDVTTCMTDLDQLSKTQAQLAWKVGDRLLMIREEAGNEPGWITTLRRRYPEALGAFSPSDITLYMGAAETFSDAERKLGLAWCMYAYCLRHTSNPRAWILRAEQEKWAFGDMRLQILAEEPRRPKGTTSDTQTPPACILAQDILGRTGKQLGRISCHINLTDVQVEPRIVVELLEKRPLYLEEATAFSEAVDICIHEVKVYLHTAGLVVDAPDLQTRIARAA